MISILLVILLIIAITMIATVLIQRSEGGALGIGGQTGGLISARGSANLLTRTTTVLAFLFMAVCLILAVLTGGERGTGSVVEEEAVPAGEAWSADIATEPEGPVVPEAAGELMIIPGDAPAPGVPDAGAGDEFLVIPDDSVESWDPGAAESLPAPTVPEPDADLPPVPDEFAPVVPESAPALPEPADSGDFSPTPAVPSAE